MGPDDIEIRAITEGELGAWAYVLDASFLLPVPAGTVAYRQELYVPGRSLGAFGPGARTASDRHRR
jgi:hypothetical protein